MTDSDKQYIYIYGTGALVDALGSIEDDLQDLLSPHAEVTGSGSGEDGWNIDVEYFEADAVNWVLGKIINIIDDAVPIREYPR